MSRDSRHSGNKRCEADFQVPEGVNAYDGIEAMAAMGDELDIQCYNALRQAMKEEGVFEKAYRTIGDLVIRFSFAANNHGGLEIDYSSFSDDEARFVDKIGDIYERWQRILEP